MDAEPILRSLRWSFLGRVPYAAAEALQARLRQELRPAGSAGNGGSAGRAAAVEQREPKPEHLLLLEHPHVYTLGRNADATDVLATPEWRAARGVEVAETDRGGQVTYHGPGQLVGYPIIDLSPDRRDIRRYVRDLEEVLIRTLAGYGIEAGLRDGAEHIGVWVGDEKIAAIGVHLSRWITTHGFALNVSTDLSLFSGIVPCGLRAPGAGGVTSMGRLLAAPPPALAAVAERVARHFADVFGRSLIAVPPTEITGDAAAGGA